MENSSVIVIKGRTRDGRLFRPSDWAQRLALSATAGSCPVDRPACFHRHVHVGEIDGVPAVFIDAELERTEPGLFGFLTAFALLHELECTPATEPVDLGDGVATGAAKAGIP